MGAFRTQPQLLPPAAEMCPPPTEPPHQDAGRRPQHRRQVGGPSWASWHSAKSQLPQGQAGDTPATSGPDAVSCSALASLILCSCVTDQWFSTWWLCPQGTLATSGGSLVVTAGSGCAAGIRRVVRGGCCLTPCRADGRDMAGRGPMSMEQGVCHPHPPHSL